MHEKLRSIAFKSSSAYFFLCVVIALPYFNWQYARQHGFASWIIFGEIIASCRALIWPYYVVSGLLSQGADRERIDSIHYLNSKRACDEAMQLVVRFGGLSRIPLEESTNFERLVEAAAMEGVLVSSAYLDRVHPELGAHYRDEYLHALQLMLEGIRTEDISKQINGSARYNAFGTWMKTHAVELRFP